jgi:hypothetical protein
VRCRNLGTSSEVGTQFPFGGLISRCKQRIQIAAIKMLTEVDKMQTPLDNEALDRVERLVAELRAIERWDEGHRRDGFPEGYERLSFIARQERRSEIVSQLLSIVPRLDLNRHKNQSHPGEGYQTRAALKAS